MIQTQVLLCALVIFLLQGAILAFESESNSTSKKIAFLFLSRGPMPLEEVWREFFHHRADPNLFSIYVHPHPGFKYSHNSLFFGKEVSHNELSGWGDMSQVKAIKTLVRAALEDPLNEWFTLMSETCIPLHSFSKWRKSLMENKLSIVNACPMDEGEMELELRWKPELEKVGIKKSHWRKSGTWFALNRKHAMVFVNETVTEPAWETVACVDEHYLPTILAMNHLDNETTCSDGFVHHIFGGTGSHPHVHRAEEVGADLFAFLSRPLGKSGFGKACTGLPDMCHFTARKFGHLQTLLRVSEDGDKYYLWELGRLRLFPNSSAVVVGNTHLNKSLATVLSEAESREEHMGMPFPARTDGLVVKAPKRNDVYLIRDLQRHTLENFDTFLMLGFKQEDIQVMKEGEIELIPIGESIDLTKKPPPITTAERI